MNEVCALVTEDKEKAELLNAFFVSVYNARDSPEESRTPEAPEEVGIKEEFALVGEGWVKDRLSKLDIQKSMDPDGMHLRVLRELAEVIARPRSITFGKSWALGEVAEYWRKVNVTPVFRKGKKEEPGIYRPVRPTSIPGKVMEQLILEVIYKYVEVKVIGSTQH